MEIIVHRNDNDYFLRIEVIPDPISQDTFEVGVRKFGFKKVRVSYKGAVVTSVEVMASQKLQQELVSISSGMIYEILN